MVKVPPLHTDVFSILNMIRDLIDVLFVSGRRCYGGQTTLSQYNIKSTPTFFEVSLQ